MGRGQRQPGAGGNAGPVLRETQLPNLAFSNYETLEKLSSYITEIRIFVPVMLNQCRSERSSALYLSCCMSDRHIFM